MAYLVEERYRGEGWTAETPEPRPKSGVVSPHGRVQVWFNETLIASQRAGHGEFQGSAHVSGSMAVKEFYDDADQRLGRAAMLKFDGPAFHFVYFCDGPQERCWVQGPTDPYYGVGSRAECSGCHGGLIFTKAP